MQNFKQDSSIPRPPQPPRRPVAMAVWKTEQSDELQRISYHTIVCDDGSRWEERWDQSRTNIELVEIEPVPGSPRALVPLEERD